MRAAAEEEEEGEEMGTDIGMLISREGNVLSIMMASTDTPWVRLTRVYYRATSTVP